MYFLDDVRVRDNGFSKHLKPLHGCQAQTNHHCGVVESQVRIISSYVPSQLTTWLDRSPKTGSSTHPSWKEIFGCVWNLLLPAYETIASCS